MNLNTGKTKISRIEFIGCMAIFGTIGLFRRLVPLSSEAVAFLRAFLAACLIGIYFIVKKEKLNLKSLGKSLWLIVLSGAAMGFNWVLLFEAYNYTTISIATLSYYFAPVLVIVFSPVLLKEKLTLKQICCFIAATLGLVLIIGVSGKGGSSNITGIMYGLGAAVLYASVILLNKFLGEIPGIHRTFLQFIVCIIVLFPYVMLKGGFHFELLDTQSTIIMLVIGFFLTGIPYCLYFSSMSYVSGQELSILSYIDPLVACIVSVLFLNESLSIMQVIGGVILIGATLFNELNIGTKPEKNK